MKTITTARRRTALLAAGGLGLAIALGACGASTPDATVTPAAQPASSTAGTTPTTGAAEPSAATAATQPSGTGTAAPLAEITVMPAEAASTALRTVPSSRVVGIDLDREQGTVVWDVDVVAGKVEREVIVDATTGTVLANRVDDDDSGDSDDVAKDLRLLAAATLDHAAALQAALDQISDGRVVDLELDESDGAVEWEVEVIAPDRVKHELTIDALTGKVTRHESD